MNKGIAFSFIVALMAGSSTAFAGTPQATIEGNYVEVRSCDVYTAACFANSEVGLTGEEAVMAWDVTRGTQDNVDLSGLKVVAVVRTNNTLGDVSEVDHSGRGLILVDEKANVAQRDALISLAREMADGLLDEVIRVESAPIKMAMHENGVHGTASVVAGDSVTIETRSLTHHDKHCGNDEAYYPPLTSVHNAMAAFTELDRFSGAGLGVTWNDSGRRSAYLASFSK